MPNNSPNPAPYEYALSLLCDLHTPSTPGPIVDHVTLFVANLFNVPLAEVGATVVGHLAARERDMLAAAQQEGQTEADLYGDNADEGG